MRGGHGRRGRRSVRMVRPTLLLLLHQCPAHGYTLLEQLEEFGLGDTNASAIYRMLRDMEAAGWVTSTWDKEQTQGPPRRVYCLTALGDKMLAQWTQDLEQSKERIGYLLRVYHRHMEEGEGEYHET